MPEEQPKNNLYQIMNDALKNYNMENEEEEVEEPDYDEEELIRDVYDINSANNMVHEGCKKIREGLAKFVNCSNKCSYHITKKVNEDNFSAGLVKENAKELKKMSETLGQLAESMNEPLLKSMSLSEQIGMLLDRYYEIADGNNVEEREFDEYSTI